MIELIAKIFGAVSRTTRLMRLSALLASDAVAAMTAFVRIKNKKEPLSQTGAYLSYVTVCKSGSDTVIR